MIYLVYLVYFVYLVYLVDFVCPVYFVSLVFLMRGFISDIANRQLNFSQIIRYQLGWPIRSSHCTNRPILPLHP